MEHIHIEGVPPYDGDYPFEDFGTFTTREWETIKRISGVRVMEFADAGKAGDAALVLALAVIALQRAGKHVDEDVLWDAELGKVMFVAEADAGPPASLPENRLSGTTGSNGIGDDGSAVTASHPAIDPSRIGTPA